MKRIMESSEIPAEDEALMLLARAAEGGMRDALSLLDQAISFSDEKVTVGDVLAVTGTASQQHLAQIAHSFYEKDVSTALQVSGELMHEGKDPVRLIGDLIYYFRDLLLYKTAPNLEELLERVRTDESFADFSAKADSNWIYSCISQLNQAQQDMKWTNHPKIFLETTMIRICHQEKAVSAEGASVSGDVGKLVQRIDQLENELRQLKQNGIAAAPEQTSQQQPAERRSFKGKAAGISSGQTKEMLKKASKQNLMQLKSGWGDILEKVKVEKVSAYALLSGAEPAACSDQHFLLSFKHEIHSQMASADNIRSCVESAVYSTIGKSLSMMTILQPDWEKIKQEFIQEQQGQSPEAEKKKQEESDPLITEALKLVGDDLIEFEEE
jgi:DNA polymerase-3 subunit gamma/tau